MTVDTSTGECWKMLKEFPDYWVSSFGRILSRRKIPEKILVQTKNKDGYLTVILYDEKGNQKHFLSHRLVALAFLGESKMEVNHKDKNKENNNIGNLEYCTRLENCLHRDKGKRRFVTYHKGIGEYYVQISSLEPRIRGKYDTKEEAYKAAYDEYLKHFNTEPWSLQ